MTRSAMMILAGSFIAISVGRAANASPDHAKERPVCRSVARTGSIIPKRVCLTAAQWQAITDANSRSANLFYQSYVPAGDVSGR